jgi:hypothetical protein
VLKDNLRKVNRKWHGECLELAGPISEEDVIEKFTNPGILLARDAVEVYSTIGGFDENDSDSELLTFWTVEKILREIDFNAEVVYFADFLIDSHHYCFKYKNDESSAIYVHYSETDRYKIADSFDQFFGLYLNNINELFP